jgi:HSP20 family protein
MALIRWNPSRELLNVEREFKKMFDLFEGRFGISTANGEGEEYENAVWSPLTDIEENENNYLLKVDLPGVKKDDLKISYSEGQLSISGERKQEKVTKDSKVHRVERAYGKYYRSFSLPKKIKEDKINAEFIDGQLTIIIPKVEEAKPKEIEISVN